jgi:SAM-dependent methyltransferase
MGRLRFDRIRALLPDTADSVLEIGCGEGAAGYRLARRYRYLGLEPDQESAAVAARRLAGVGEVRCAEASSVVGQQFDLVCAFEVLEHLADDRAALRSWRALVRPGGHLLISVPAHAARFGPADDAVGHYRRYEPAALRSLLTESGLGNVRLVMYGAPLGYLIEAGRNRSLARQTNALSREQRTAASGRLLQPRRPVVAAVTAAAVAPFAVVQRAFPRRGVGIVARGQV